jgi:hypothetical protein
MHRQERTSQSQNARSSAASTRRDRDDGGKTFHVTRHGNRMISTPVRTLTHRIFGKLRKRAGLRD